MIKGFTHSGFAVSNLESALDFFKEKLSIEEIRSQLSDQEYLAKVTGFPGACLKIGFVRKKGDSFPLEIIEYIHPRGNQHAVVLALSAPNIAVMRSAILMRCIIAC